MSAESDFLRMIIDFMNDDPMTATYHQFAQGSYDFSTDTYTTVPIDTPVRAILLDLDRTNNGFSSKFNTLISSGDKELYMFPTQLADNLAAPIVPDPTKDSITVAGIKYKIHVVKSADPKGSNPLLYNFLLRR